MRSFLKEIVDFWKETWKNNKLIFFLESFGTMLGMVAATLINFSSTNPNMELVLPLYLISSCCLAYTSYYRKNSWMVVLMIFYTIVTFVGIVKLI